MQARGHQTAGHTVGSFLTGICACGCLADESGSTGTAEAWNHAQYLKKYRVEGQRRQFLVS